VADVMLDLSLRQPAALIGWQALLVFFVDKAVPDEITEHV
jgi:hypothetical protein